MTYVMKAMKFLSAFRVMDSDSSYKNTKGIEVSLHLRVLNTLLLGQKIAALLQLILWIIRAIYNILGKFKTILVVVWNSRYLFSQGPGCSQVILNILKTLK